MLELNKIYCIDVLEGLPSIDGLDQLIVSSEWKLDVACFGGCRSITHTRNYDEY